MPRSLASPKATAVKSVLIVVSLLVGAAVVFKLPTVYLYLLLFVAGTGAFCMIAFQLVGMMREESGEAAVAMETRRAARTSALVEKLPADDRIVLDWARECLDQGSSLEAGVKLERVSAAHRNHPDVLRLRCDIYRAESRWHAALEVAKTWAKADPGDVAAWEAQAACLEEMKLYQQAADVLLPLAQRFASRPDLPYQLARLASQMGRLEEAQRWLFKALDVGDKSRLAARALADNALQPLVFFLGRTVLVEKLVAGGLRGAECAALDFAVAHGIDHTGWAAKPRSGEERGVQEQYSLTATESAGWQERTDLNVRYSDATVVFTLGPEMAGAAARAVEAAAQMHKPCLRLQREGLEGDPVAQFLTFLEKHQVHSLNITGSTATREPPITDFVAVTLAQAFDYQMKLLLRGTRQPATLHPRRS
jgi:tetratricopeptide (TPR) repeat protein